MSVLIEFSFYQGNLAHATLLKQQQNPCHLAVIKSWKNSSTTTTKKTGDNTKQVYQRNVKEATMIVKGHSSSST